MSTLRATPAQQPYFLLPTLVRFESIVSLKILKSQSIFLRVLKHTVGVLNEPAYHGNLCATFLPMSPH